jgi:hypothetical protein
MHMFFAALKKNGRPLEASERQSLIDTVRAQVMFPEAARVFDVSPAPCSLVVGVSNEPEGGFWEA